MAAKFIAGKTTTGKTIFTFISDPDKGVIYCAEPVRFGSRKLIWSAMPERGCGDSVISSNYVPLKIRREAYRLFRPFA
jgi:hypothetical protein